MKPSWKEILVIFVLAVLVTGFSSVFDVRHCAYECPPGAFCNFSLCSRGFPIPYLASLGGYPLAKTVAFFIIDVLFYFVLFWPLWAGFKLAMKKIRK